MSSLTATRAPFQMETLSNEKLLEMFCQTGEEAPFLALWERMIDFKDTHSIGSQLRKTSRYVYPRGSDPNWVFLGSQSWAHYRFKVYVCRFRGKLDTPAFEYFKKWLVWVSIIDEYRFEKGRHADLFEQLGNLGLDVDDEGHVVRPPELKDDIGLDQINQDRQEEEERVLARELGDGGHNGDAE